VQENDEDWEELNNHDDLYTLIWKDKIPINLNENFKIKVVDFGNACWKNKKFTDNIQTREYRAPETIIGAEYEANTDIWSFACLIFELLTNNYLFKPEKQEDAKKSDVHLAMF
jgi:serine/threonine protein kinase